MKAKRPVTPADILLSAGVFAVYLPYVHGHDHLVPAVVLGAVSAGMLLGKKRFPVPTLIVCLIISGALDPDTPPVWGREVARLFPGATHLEIAGIAHSGSPSCVRAVVTQFIAKGTTDGATGSVPPVISTWLWRPPWISCMKAMPPLA